MGKLVIVALLAIGGIYGTGYISLGESGVIRFLNESEQLTSDGNGHALCEMVTDDVRVDIDDHTAPRRGKFNGGKEAYCEQTKTAVAAIALLKPTMQVQRNDLKLKRELLHPWTVEVTYTELRTMTIPRANVDVRTESDDKLVLVRTFSGIKIQRLESEIWAQ